MLECYTNYQSQALVHLKGRTVQWNTMCTQCHLCASGMKLKLAPSLKISTKISNFHSPVKAINDPGEQAAHAVAPVGPNSRT